MFFHMKAAFTSLFLFSLLFWLANCKTSQKPAATPPTPPPVAAPAPAPATDLLAADRAKYLEKVRKSIAGKEKMQADSVFENLKKLNKMPAERVLGIMDRWGETLGVSCDHCHVPNEWASESKAPKEITRQMMALIERVNTDIQSIQAIKSERPGVSCYTCHRGEAKPARRPK